MGERYALGIDIGGTKIGCCVCSDSGKVPYYRWQPTGAERPKDEILDDIARMAARAGEYARKKGYWLAGTGVGIPGYRSEHGKVCLGPNNPTFQGKGIYDEIRRRLGKNVKTENDSKCFALAEHTFGAAKGSKDSVGLIWGTGLACGIIIGGRIHRGWKGFAGEIGHAVVEPGAEISGRSGLRGELESFCSGPNLVKYYRHFGGRKKAVKAKEIIAGTDPASRKTSLQCRLHLAGALALLVSALNPETIVVGGGVSKSCNLRELKEMTDSFLHEEMRGSFRIARSRLGQKAGAVGAACLVLKGGKNKA